MRPNIAICLAVMALVLALFAPSKVYAAGDRETVTQFLGKCGRPDPDPTSHGQEYCEAGIAFAVLELGSYTNVNCADTEDFSVRASQTAAVETWLRRHPEKANADAIDTIVDALIEIHNCHVD